MRFAALALLLCFPAACAARGGAHHSTYNNGGYSAINRGPGYTGGTARETGYGSYGYSAWGNYGYLYGYSDYVGGLNDATPMIGIPSGNWNSGLNQGQLPNMTIQRHR